MEQNTATVTKESWDGNFKELAEYGSNDSKRVVETPIFIIFAEYLGYVSRFNKLAEDWCDGKVPELHVQKIMMIEANCIFHAMKKDYGIDTVAMYYDLYTPIILSDYIEKLSKITCK